MVEDHLDQVHVYVHTHTHTHTHTVVTRHSKAVPSTRQPLKLLTELSPDEKLDSLYQENQENREKASGTLNYYCTCHHCATHVHAPNHMYIR